MMPGPRLAKCDTLYGLAQRSGGNIVELGTFRGCGSIALAYGARAHLGSDAHVWTIDDYEEKRGWAAEVYLPDDLDICRDNLRSAGVEDTVTVICAEVQAAAAQWELPVNLLFWDLGINGRLAEDFDAWAPHLVVGGTFAIHDTMDRKLGSSQLVERAVASGNWMDGGFLPGGVQVLVKRRK